MNCIVVCWQLFMLVGKEVEEEEAAVHSITTTSDTVIKFVTTCHTRCTTVINNTVRTKEED